MTINLDELEAVARAQEAAYTRMLDTGEGVGGLGVYHPDMFKDMLAWDDLSENEHADIILALIAELRRARECIEKAEAERDRYHAAIEKAVRTPNEFEWDVPPTAKQILAAALDEMKGRD